MPTILDALKIKDGGNTPANTITDFLRAHNDAPLTTGDVTIASYIANSPTYDPIAPVPSNDSQIRDVLVFYDGSTRTYDKMTNTFTDSYKDQLQGMYSFTVQNSASGLWYPEGDDEVYYKITDVNDVVYRVPGSIVKAGWGSEISRMQTMLDVKFFSLYHGKPAAFIMGHRSKLAKETQMIIVSLPWETASSISIKRLEYHLLKKL